MSDGDPRAESTDRPARDVLDDVRFERRLSLAMAALLVVALVGSCFGAAEQPRWRAQYFANLRFTGAPVSRWEQRMRFDWARRAPDPAIPADEFSARFETCLVLPDARRVAFLLTSDDDASLEVDQERVIDLPGAHPPQAKGVEMDLPEGSHHLRILYQDRGSRASVELNASLDGNAPRQIPNDYLERPASGRCRAGE